MNIEFKIPKVCSGSRKTTDVGKNNLSLEATYASVIADSLLSWWVAFNSLSNKTSMQKDNLTTKV
jgi:hypothetical protein